MSIRSERYRTNIVFQTILKRNLLIIMLMFGIYHRLSACRVLRLFSLFYCVLFGVFYIVLTITLSLRSHTANPFYSVTLTIESSVYILTSLISQDETITQLPKNIYPDKLILPNSRDIKSFAPYVMLVSLIIGRIIICILKNDLERMFSIFYVLHVLKHMTCFVGRLDAVSAADTYRKAIKALKESVIVKLERGNLTDGEKVVYLKKFLQVYKKIADYLNFTSIFRFKMLLGFACDFLKNMFVVYYIISNNSFLNTFVLTWILEIAIHWYILFAAVVLVEAAAGHLDDIKETLANQLLQCKGETFRASLYDTLDYIDIQSRNVLWNKFPMNFGLILDFVGTCTAYVIALLQFNY